MKTYTLTLTEQHLQVILSALSELPLKVAAQPFQAINNQINRQQMAEAAEQQRAAAAADTPE